MGPLGFTNVLAVLLGDRSVTSYSTHADGSQLAVLAFCLAGATAMVCAALSRRSEIRP